MVAPIPIPIAIIGMGCRFPGNTTDPEKLWSLLAEGRNSWTDVPGDRFNERAFYHPNADFNGSHNHRGGHFLDQNIAAFDAEFFGISPIEAKSMDPQQRILLETSYEAFESSGILLENLRGSKTAVYVAMFTRDYDRNIYRDTSDIPKYHTTGCGEAIVSNRISYIFDLKGPSMTLDTGCSGSMVALHQACQSLRTGESNMALAGGVNLILNPDQMIGMSNLQSVRALLSMFLQLTESSMLNDQGKSYPFDARGAGYGRGEGVASIVLKRLDDALQSKDPIRAIICNTAINQDGKTFGITLPSVEAQEFLERSVFEEADIDPLDMHYVEAHGTGTTAGDLVEMQAIANVLCKNRERPLYVGSIKSNIGHLESSSGLAGVIKAVLVLEKELIPPNSDFVVAKAGLHLDDWNIKVRYDSLLQTYHTNREQIPLKLEAFPGLKPLRASVNSFGYGGTNAHVILEQAPKIRWKESLTEVKSLETRKLLKEKASIIPEAQEATPRLYVFSALSKESALAIATNYREWMTPRQHDDYFLGDLAYTLACRRSHMKYRLSIVANSYQGLLSALKQTTVNDWAKRTPHSPQVGFIFTGQGAQWYAMGRELISTHSRFRDSILKSSAILQDHGAPWYLIDELFLDETESRINESKIAQPATTALQIALVDLLSGVGVHPRVVLGHSSGEIAAAYAAGFLSQTTALRISYHRSFVTGNFHRAISVQGAMLAVGLGEQDVLAHLTKTKQDTVSIACVNSPTSTTISGDEPAILELKQLFDRLSIFNRKLNVDTAYHSHHMEQKSQDYFRALDGLQSNCPLKDIRFISTVTASEKTENFGPAYWVENLVSKVCYRDAIKEYFRMQRDDFQPGMAQIKHILIEIGPHAALAGPTRQTIDVDCDAFDYAYLPSLVKGQDAIQSILNLAGKLFKHGVLLDFETINSLSLAQNRRAIIPDLPTYPWDHSNTYWFESRLSRDYRLRKYPYHDLLGVREPSSTSIEPRWRYIIDLDNLPWLERHIVDKVVVFPGAGYICMAIEAVRQLADSVSQSSSCILNFVATGVSFRKALVIPRIPGKIEMQLSLSPRPIVHGKTVIVEGEFRVTALSQEGLWHEHCCGSIRVRGDSLSGKEQDLEPENQDCFPEQADYFEKKSRTNLYAELDANGNTYSQEFAAIVELSVGKGHAVALAEIPDIASVMPSNFMQPHIIHPTTLDALMHSSLLLYYQKYASRPVVPVSIDEIVISSTVEKISGKRLIANTTFAPHGARRGKAEILVCNSVESSQGSQPAITLKISGLELQGLGEMEPEISTSPGVRNISYQMIWDADVDFVPLSLINRSHPSLQDSLSKERKLAFLNRAASIYIHRCLDRLKTTRFTKFKRHHVELIRWMELYDFSHQQPLANGMSISNAEDILEQGRRQGVDGEMLSRLGQGLLSILTEDVDPLQLMLKEELLHKFHTEGASLGSYSHIRRYLEYLCFKDPHLAVLEVGAATGATTLPLLEALSLNSHARLYRYDFTDVSAVFFDEARNLLRRWIDVVQFKTLDIEQDPLEQGFSSHSYDIIVAANVLHRTKSIGDALRNVHQLLKHGGRLILIDVRQQHPFLRVIFGSLPGWCKGMLRVASPIIAEASRVQSNFTLETRLFPLLSKDQWHQALSCRFFNGVELSIDGPAQISTTVVSRAIDTRDKMLPRSLKIIIGEQTQENLSSFPFDLSLELEKHGLQPSFISWGSDFLQTEAAYIVIDHGEKPILTDLTPEVFRKITALLTHGTNILWISIQKDALDVENPEKALITGLSRSAHAENEQLNLVTLDIQQVSHGYCQHLLETITSVFLRSLHTFARGDLRREREYIYRGNQILIPRLIPDREMNEWIARKVGNSQATCDIYGQPQRPLTLNIGGLKSRDRLKFIDDEVPRMQLDPFAIEVEVKAHGLNYGGVMFALGETGSSSALGECAGFVIAVGARSKKFCVGDRVCAWGVGALFASRVRVYSNNACHLPSYMPFDIGASIPVAFMTAYHILVQVADLQKGQSIFVHSANEEIGQAALLIAEYIGATIFATVSSNSERAELAGRLDLSLEQVLSTKAGHFKHKILELTKGHGCDLVLDCSIADDPSNTWACVSSLGNFIRLRDPGRDLKDQKITLVLDKNATVISFDLPSLYREQPHKTDALLTKVMSIFEKRSLLPRHTITTMSITEIGEAFEIVRRRKQFGKVVLEVGECPTVEVIDPTHPLAKLDKKATYVIAGGLGDLGQRLCRLMIQRGARHILIISRRSLESEQRQKIEAEFSSIAEDARFYSKSCDVGIESQLQEIVSSLAGEGIPPIKGVIQASVVLRVSSSIYIHSSCIFSSFKDCALRNMTLDDFQIPLRTKLYGTRNLCHSFRNAPLDFFLSLSSAIGIIGTAGQANYAAGNTFQDAFISSHTDHKFRYLSLDIGMIEGADVNNTVIEQSLRRQGLVPIKPEELLAFFEYVISKVSSQAPCKQAVIGFDEKSLSQRTVGLNGAPTTAMFNHVWQPATHGASDQGSKPLQKVILNTQDPKEKYQIVAAAIGEWITGLVTLNSRELSLDLSVAELGLDSLMTIELKNWIAREFGVVIQVFNILDHKNIHALAAKVVSSIIVNLSNRAPSGQENRQQPDTHAFSEQVTTTEIEGLLSRRRLPRLPLPDLKNTMKLYLNSRQAFLSAEGFDRISNSIEEFQKDGGIGQELQSRLTTLANDPFIDDWQSDLYAANIYLSRRDPVHPTGTFYGGHLISVSHGQAERAAVLSSAAFVFKQLIETNTVAPDFLNEEPLCMNSSNWIFNATRTPGIKIDKMHRFPGNDYLVVLRHGHIFKVLLKDRGQAVSISSLNAIFQWILDEANQALPSVAALTADERSSWAEVRHSFVRFCPSSDGE